jgi:hypothetical protein
MSYAYFAEPMSCPECGHVTHELTTATSRSSGQEILMCEVCFVDSDEGLNERDENWEERDSEYTGDLLF